MCRIIHSVLIMMHLLPDINECETINGGCEQICTNAIGSFACSCGIGYLLDGNGFNCTGNVIICHHGVIFCTIVNDILYSVQISMNVTMMTLTTVMRMHSAPTQMGVSSAPATLATLEMESTVQVSSLYVVR